MALETQGRVEPACHHKQDGGRLAQSEGVQCLWRTGGGQAEAVADHLNSMQGRGDIPQFTGVRTVDDFRGVKRFVIASRS